MVNTIEVIGVNKDFVIHHERHQSLKERLLHPGTGSSEKFRALENISFAIGAGETVGILGHNGSGKSTLLKTICGVLAPTSGEIKLRGNLAALLELGAGFQPELSGRENVYLYGAMLGLKRREVAAIFDEIVEFSEIGQFIDTQVKFYSSGMYVRLAFAVAVNVNPDILVVDEVLAVGDERFQAKCMDRIMRFQQEGRTILLVTHNADQVRRLCSRAIVLNRGLLVADGPTGESLKTFRDYLHADESSPNAAASDHIQIISVTTPSGSFDVRTGAGMHFDVGVQSAHAYAGHFFMELYSRGGELISRSDASSSPVQLTPGANSIGIDIAQMPLLDGVYDVNLAIVDELGQNVMAWSEKAATIQVSYDGREQGIVEIAPTITQL
ncbi:MAG: ABC transporter ATP-binding protein [Actinomycetota bacterium]|jgi:ABC-2 type transport system ATP-binding protein